MFKIGMKVICISTFTSIGRYSEETNPKKGDILTIREIEEFNCLMFEEIHNPILLYKTGYGECSYNPSKFVPLEEKFERITYSKVLEEVECCSN